jgi:peptidoglycan hydrolase-like protein with peptidoglycan-binding domain
MISARTLSVFCLGLALLVVGGALMPAFGAVGGSDGPMFTSPGEIREAQRILEQEKYLRPGAGRPGQMDDATMAALRAFQRAHFLRATGLIDLDTMGSLVGHGLRQSSGRMARTGSGGRRSEERVALTAATETASGRTMPATGSPTLLAAAIGTLLIGAGLAIIYLRRTT